MSSDTVSQDPQTGDDYDVVWSAQSFTFGLIVLGAAAIVAVIVAGLLMIRFPTLKPATIWMGAAGIMVFLLVIGWKFLFGSSQLQIGKDRIRILDAWGNVSDDIHYSWIANIRLVKKTSVGEKLPRCMSGGFGLGGLMSPGANDTFAASDIEGSTIRERRYLGIRFQDDNAGADRGELMQRARIRGEFQGCDWVLSDDFLQATLGAVAQRIHERWLAFHGLATSEAGPNRCSAPAP